MQIVTCDASAARQYKLKWETIDQRPAFKSHATTLMNSSTD